MFRPCMFIFNLCLSKALRLACLVFLAFLGGSTVTLGEGFRASLVKVDITPSEPQWLLG